MVAGKYLRTVLIGDHAGIIECRPDSGGAGSLCLTLHGIETRSLLPLVHRTRDLFDLDAPVADIATAFAADRRLGKLIKRTPGIRVPGAWDGFELAVRAIIGQQVSVKAATTIAGRIAARFGPAITLPATLPPTRGQDKDGAGLSCLFPDAAALVHADLEAVGLVSSRAGCIRQLAAAVVAGEVNFDALQGPESFCKGLLAIRGVGEWTAQYVSMRALKHPDAFPASDLGLLKAFDRQGRPRIKAPELAAIAESWRPWRAYAAMLLWAGDNT